MRQDLEAEIIKSLDEMNMANPGGELDAEKEAIQSILKSVDRYVEELIGKDEHTPFANVLGTVTPWYPKVVVRNELRAELRKALRQQVKGGE